MMKMQIRHWGEATTADGKGKTDIFEAVLQDPLPLAGRSLDFKFAVSAEGLAEIHRATAQANVSEAKAAGGRFM